MPETRFLVVFDGADVRAYRRCVYALLDPSQPDRVMYVGKTSQHPLTRLDNHIWDAQQGRVTTACCRWIASLLSAGTAPSIAVLAVVPLSDDLADAEQDWIKHYRRIGQATLNSQIRLRRKFEEELATSKKFSSRGLAQT